MASFTHFVLTRFNLFNLGRELDDAWYDQRFQLFERFCLPSVRGQTNQDFRWLLFADSKTPAAHRVRIEAYQSYANLEVSYLNGFDGAGMVSFVRARLDDETSHLVTTNLDNDDALGRDFVAQVQAQFTGQQFELVNFLHGLRYDLLAEKLYACQLESNPFISLIEAIGSEGQARTVAALLPHSTIRDRFGQIHNVDAKPLWLQVIHGRNAAPTGTWGLPRVSNRQLTADFDLAYDVPAAAAGEGSFRVQNAWARLERRAINSLSLEQRRRLREWLRKVRR